MVLISKIGVLVIDLRAYPHPPHTRPLITDPDPAAAAASPSAASAATYHLPTDHADCRPFIQLIRQITEISLGRHNHHS